MKLKRPTGIENTVPTDVGVTAQIEEKTIEQTLRQVPVEIEGQGESQRVWLGRSQTTVQLTGGYGFISGLRKDDVRLFVDVSGLEPGTYTLPVQIHIDNAEDFTCALGSPEISVTVEAR